MINHRYQPRFDQTPDSDSDDPVSIAAQSELDDLGPLSLFGCRTFLLLAPLALTGAIASGPFPPTVLLVAPALAAAALAPRKVLLRIQVSIPLFWLVGWTSLSYLWSLDQGGTLRTLREEFGPLLGLVLVAGMLPVEETMRWFVKGMKVLLLVSVIGIIVDPATRSTVSEGTEQLAWEAWFRNKNQFGRNMTLAFLTLLVWDKTAWSRWFWIVVSLVLVVGSFSAAALASTLGVIGLVAWVRRYQAVGDRWSGSFALVSITSGICALLAAFFSAAWLVGLLGRDLTFTGRTRIWTPVLEAVGREPLFGYGYGAALFSSGTRDSRTLAREIGFDAANAHSGPLQVASEIGLLGLALFMVLYLATMTAAIRRLREGVVACWVFVFLWIQLLVGVVEPVYMGDWLPPLVLGWILLARTAATERRVAAAAGPTSRLGVPWPELDLDSDVVTKVNE